MQPIGKRRSPSDSLSPVSFKTVSSEQIQAVTRFLSAERFCEGHLQSVLRSGHIIAILRRPTQMEEKEA
jgi:hypothetical protein